MGEIADRLTLSPGGVTKLIDRLEASGYVARSPDPSDRRAVAVGITEEGLAVLERSRPVIVAALDELWGRHVSDEEAESVLGVLSGVHKANWCS